MKTIKIWKTSYIFFFFFFVEREIFAYSCTLSYCQNVFKFKKFCYLTLFLFPYVALTIWHWLWIRRLQICFREIIPSFIIPTNKRTAHFDSFSWLFMRWETTQICYIKKSFFNLVSFSLASLYHQKRLQLYGLLVKSIRKNDKTLLLKEEA